MFGTKDKSAKEEEKHRKPQAIPDMVQKYLISDCKLPAHLAPIFKAAMHKKADEEHAFQIRIFDESEALARKVTIVDYA